MTKITITIDREVWKRLVEYKIKHEELKTFEDIILYFLKKEEAQNGERTGNNK